MLRLPDALRAELEAWIGEGYPHETCGLLIGRPLEGSPPAAGASAASVAPADTQLALGSAEVTRVLQARNLNRERAHDRYELDPRDFMQAELAAREAGLEVVGIWHSHPDHPAEPSETDRAAAWEGWSYVIATVTSEGVTAMRSFRLARERFHEEALTT